MLMTLLLIHSINCLIGCVSEMVKNNYLSPFRSKIYQISKFEHCTTPAIIDTTQKYISMTTKDIEKIRASLLKCKTDNISNSIPENQISLSNKKDQNDYSNENNMCAEYSTISECKMNNFTNDVLEKYNRNMYSNCIKKQEIIAIERLAETDRELEIELNEMRTKYKQLCMKLEAKKATKRLEEVNRYMTKQPIIDLGQWIIHLPRPLNQSEKEKYVNYLLNSILHDLHDINNVVMGELLDDDVITTVMENCQEKHPSILFVNPCITQCIQFSKNEEVALFLDPLKAKLYDNIFFIINDTSNGGRGIHWSLLLLNKEVKAFCHYDSLKSMNYKIALELSKKLSSYFEIWQIIEVDCEQQTNNTDCGIYVLDNMLRIILVLKNDVNVDNESITFLKISKLPPSFTKTRIYMMNTYISSILQKVRRSLQLEPVITND